MSLRCFHRAVMFVVLWCASIGVWACYYGNLDDRPLPELIAELGKFAGEDVEGPQPARAMLIRSLRLHGQDAVDALMDQRSTWGTRNGEVDSPKVRRRLDDLIDKVAGQKHATVSRLFWHTSMTAAQREAKKSGKPILSLRMLGRLDEDFSCANSRFFRTMLYPDPRIADQLRERFVLHWQPVRDVPQVTIDFGDGRKLLRPLVGNSVHLVLDHQCKPIDAMPGLVSPVEFASWLGTATELWKQIEKADVTEVRGLVAQHHRRLAQQARQRSQMAIKPEQSVAQLDPTDRRWLNEATPFQKTGLSAESRTLIAKLQPAAAAMPLALSKSFVETPLLRMVRQIDENVARDTAFNLLALKPKIDDWFAQQNQELTYEKMTDRIYAEVFLMPLSDPWLGLSPEDQFVALPDAGRTDPAAKQSLRYQVQMASIPIEE